MTLVSKSLLLLLIAAPVFAAKPVNEADFPLTATVVKVSSRPLVHKSTNCSAVGDSVDCDEHSTNTFGLSGIYLVLEASDGLRYSIACNQILFGKRCFAVRVGENYHVGLKGNVIRLLAYDEKHKQRVGEYAITDTEMQEKHSDNNPAAKYGGVMRR